MIPPVPPSPPPPPLPVPPSLPDPKSGVSIHVLAHLCWITLLVSLAFQALVAAAHWSPHTRIEFFVSGLIKFSLAVGGLTCGIVALCRARKHRAPGVLASAVTGICLWVVIVVISISLLATMRYRANVRRENAKTKFSPVAHIPRGVRVQDAELGFSFELPPEYQALPKDKMPGQYRLAYIKQNGDQPAEVVVVEMLGGTILPNQHITAKDLPDKSYTLAPFVWRGLVVDGVRIPEKTPAGEYVTYKAQIPIKKEAIQIGFGGPASEEAHIHALAEQVLATLDGPVNW